MKSNMPNENKEPGKNQEIVYHENPEDDEQFQEKKPSINICTFIKDRICCCFRPNL